MYPIRTFFLLDYYRILHYRRLESCYYLGILSFYVTVFTDWQISILYNSFYLDCAIQVMSGSTSKSEATQLENTTYNILAAVGKDADFLYSTIGTYIKDAQNANRSDLVDMWNTIKKDRQRHLQMLRQALEKEAKEQKLSR